MTSHQKLVMIKAIHTIIWCMFTFIFSYMMYAVIVDKINLYVWIGLLLFGVEIVVLLIYKNHCPLTLIARRYSSSTKENFDIYLPLWLAKNNKVIYSFFLFVFFCGVIYRYWQ